MKHFLFSTLIFCNLLLPVFTSPVYALSACNSFGHDLSPQTLPEYDKFTHNLSTQTPQTKTLSLPYSIRTYDPVCWSESQSGNMILTINKHVLDNNPPESFTFYLQHSDSIGFTEYIPNHYTATSESYATFGFFSLPPGDYMLFASYHFNNGFFRMEGELWLEFVINSVAKMEISYTKKDISGMQFFDGEWESGRSAFFAFDFESIKNGTPPYEILYKELGLESSYDTIYFGCQMPIVFTLWDNNGCSLDIHDTIMISPDTLHIGISLDKPLSDANVSDAHLSIVQYNKPEVLFVEWYKNGVLLKSGLENFLYDAGAGEYYAIGYGQRTGLVSSSRIKVEADTSVKPQDTVVIPPDTIVVPPDTIITPPDTFVVPPDTIVVPPDTVIIPPDTIVAPPDTVIVPPDTIITPPDTIVAPSDTIVIPPDTIVIPPDTIIAPPDTIVAPPDTIVIPPDTIITPPDTIVIPPDTIIAPPDTVIIPPDTIVIPPDTIIAPPDTVIIPPDTIVIPPDTIIAPPDTIVAPPDTIVIPPDTIITPPDTIVIPPDTIVIPPDTIVTPPDTTVTPPIDTLIPCDSSIAADFWLCSEFTLYDIGLAVNVSLTRFDSILWTFPPEAELRYEDYHELELQFNDTGIFKVGMFGYYYNCVAEKEVSVIVNMPQQKYPEQKSSFSIINYASVYPQPITSESVLEIETGINASVNIKVYNIATGQQSVYSSLFLRANERTYLPVESEKFSSGTYILLITATAENNKTSTKTIKIISL